MKNYSMILFDTGGQDRASDVVVSGIGGKLLVDGLPSVKYEATSAKAPVPEKLQELLADRIPPGALFGEATFVDHPGVTQASFYILGQEGYIEQEFGDIGCLVAAQRLGFPIGNKGIYDIIFAGGESLTCSPGDPRYRLPLNLKIAGLFKEQLAGEVYNFNCAEIKQERKGTTKATITALGHRKQKKFVITLKTDYCLLAARYLGFPEGNPYHVEKDFGPPITVNYTPMYESLFVPPPLEMYDHFNKHGLTLEKGVHVKRVVIQEKESEFVEGDKVSNVLVSLDGPNPKRVKLSIKKDCQFAALQLGLPRDDADSFDPLTAIQIPTDRIVETDQDDIFLFND